MWWLCCSCWWSYVCFLICQESCGVRQCVSLKWYWCGSGYGWDVEIEALGVWCVGEWMLWRCYAVNFMLMRYVHGVWHGCVCWWGYGKRHVVTNVMMKWHDDYVCTGGANFMWGYVMWCDVMFWYVMWCDVMWCDVMWCGGVVWCDMMWCDTMWDVWSRLVQCVCWWCRCHCMIYLQCLCVLILYAMCTLCWLPWHLCIPSQCLCCCDSWCVMFEWFVCILHMHVCLYALLEERMGVCCRVKLLFIGL